MMPGMDVQNNIKQFAAARRMSQTDIALRSGLSANYICRIASGAIGNITLVTAKRIANALEASIEEVFVITKSSSG